MIQDILNFLFSTTGMGMVALGVICIFIIFMLKRVRPTREVLYCRERDRRGQRLSIDEETSVSLSCKTKKGPDKKFFKWGASYVFNEAGKMVTRFFGKEGTAYTYKLKQTKKNGKKEELGSLADALKTVWDEEFIKEIPKAQMKQIEKSKIFVTVDLEPGLTPEGFESVSEEDIQAEQDREAFKIMGKGLGASTKAQLYQGMLWMAFGALIIFIGLQFNLFH